MVFCCNYQGCQPACWRGHHSTSAQSCWGDARKIQVAKRALLECLVGINFTSERLQQLLPLLSNNNPYRRKIWGLISPLNLDSMFSCEDSSPCRPKPGLISAVKIANIWSKAIACCHTYLGLATLVWGAKLSLQSPPCATGYMNCCSKGWHLHVFQVRSLTHVHL